MLPYSPAFIEHYRKSKTFREKWHDVSLEMAIAVQVREIRKQRGMTQEQLAKAARLSVQTIIRIEQGTLALTKDTLAKIAEAFDCALRIEFVEHSTFLKWIFEISVNGIKVVTPFEQDLEFLHPGGTAP